jgi:hypothetical protein
MASKETCQPSDPLLLTLQLTHLFSLQRENLLRGQQEEEERLLKAIPLFCFPDGNEWASLTEYPR